MTAAHSIARWLTDDVEGLPASIDLPPLLHAMLDATPDCVKIIDTDGRLLRMNDAGCQALGVDADEAAGRPWLSLLPEAVRRDGERAIDAARQGRSAGFPGRSETANGVRHWDNLLTPIVDDQGRTQAILCVSRDVTAEVLLAKQREQSIDRERLLSRELQHRMKNLFSVALGLTVMVEKESPPDPCGRAMLDSLRQRLQALARASDAAFDDAPIAAGDADAADLPALLAALLRPYGARCEIGPVPTAIRREAVAVLALFLHELAANAVKHGALGPLGGGVRLDGHATGATLSLRWQEWGGPPLAGAPATHGFGSQMMDRVVQASGGDVRRQWDASGLVVSLSLPECVANDDDSVRSADDR